MKHMAGILFWYRAEAASSFSIICIPYAYLYSEATGYRTQINRCFNIS